ncbi:hypothetical protein V7O62_00075 [Methanolobus sp. ZRKC2]|uniref:hypothetical protein n=1 Tax=Methanolobus sp. ZRKC2 TaxID=3125783 RepID=UPI003244C54F
MKRLTISMSDELFDKLNSVENKSLFIRKLIERELDALDNMQDIDSNIPLERDIATLKGNVDELFSKLSSIEKQLAARVMQQLPEPKSQSCQTLTNYEVYPENARESEPVFSESAISGHEEMCPDLLDHNNIQNQPEWTDEKVPAIPEQVQEDKCSLSNQENIPEEAKPNPPIKSEIEDIPALHEAETTFNNDQGNEVPGAHSLSEEIQEPVITGHEIPTESQIEQATIIPEPQKKIEVQQEQVMASELEVPMETKQEQTWKMPEFEPPAEVQQEQTVVMPELETSAENQQEQTWKMPEFEPPVEVQQEQTIVIPDLEASAGNEREQTWKMPEFEPPAEVQQEQTIAMPELETPAGIQQEQEWKIPELKPPAEPQHQEQEMVIPELKPPEMTNNNAAPFSDPNPPTGIADNEPFVMSDLSSPKEGEQTPPFMPEVSETFENNNQPFAIPDLKSPEDAEAIKLPELQPETTPPSDMTGQQNVPTTEKQPLFKIHSIESSPEEKQKPFVAPSFPDTQPENIQTPPFENPEQNINPPAQQPPMNQPVKDTTVKAPSGNSSSKPDKLGSNILMYMPHGAKVKKDIIRSLISKQFSESEIEAKISELVSSGVLKLTAENGIHYLIRP